MYQNVADSGACHEDDFNLRPTSGEQQQLALTLR